MLIQVCKALQTKRGKFKPLRITVTRKKIPFQAALYTLLPRKHIVFKLLGGRMRNISNLKAADEVYYKWRMFISFFSSLKY